MLLSHRVIESCTFLKFAALTVTNTENALSLDGERRRAVKTKLADKLKTKNIFCVFFLVCKSFLMCAD